MTELAPGEKWYDTLPACKGMEEFFDYDHNGQADLAILASLRRICASCPVLQECLEDTIFYSDEYTFRAGMTPDERKIMYRRIRNKSWVKKQADIVRARASKEHTMGGAMWRNGCNCADCNFTTNESKLAARKRNRAQ